MADCKQSKNKSKCNCTYSPCPRKGICCDCISYHLSSGELPACAFPQDVEKTYDRSIENLVRTFQKRGAWW
jgi:hypothetical protein